MAMPESRNHTATPAVSAIGLLMSSPTGMVTDEIRVSTENALPIFLGSHTLLDVSRQRDKMDIARRPAGHSQARIRTSPHSTAGEHRTAPHQSPYRTGPHTKRRYSAGLSKRLKTAARTKSSPQQKDSSAAPPYRAGQVKIITGHQGIKRGQRAVEKHTQGLGQHQTEQPRILPKDLQPFPELCRRALLPPSAASPTRGIFTAARARLASPAPPHRSSAPPAAGRPHRAPHR